MPNKVDSLAVVIATHGRKGTVADTIRSIALLNAIPQIVIVVGSAQDDLPEIKEVQPFELDLIVSTVTGLTQQRNLGIKRLNNTVEYVSFLDDDIELHPNYFLEVCKVFESDRKIAGFSGAVIANGNIERIRAREMLDQLSIHPQMPFFGFYPNQWPGFYGCNMNIRSDILQIERFDESLPLYGLGEDCEMGFRLSRHGKVGGSSRCPAIHLGVKSGRISELGLGYAQIINYIYFTRKGIGFPKISTYFNVLIKYPSANFFLWLLPNFEKRKNVDRKGRFFGNIFAIKDLLLGKVDPMNLLKIKVK